MQHLYIEVMVLEVHLKAKQTDINNTHHCGMPAMIFQAWAVQPRTNKKAEKGGI
jgi:hypothetical protein